MRELDSSPAIAYFGEDAPSKQMVVDVIDIYDDKALNIIGRPDQVITIAARATAIVKEESEAHGLEIHLLPSKTAAPKGLKNTKSGTPFLHSGTWLMPQRPPESLQARFVEDSILIRYICWMIFTRKFPGRENIQHNSQ